MDFEEIENRLKFIEMEISKGNLNLKKLGFWEIVEEAKRNKKIAELLGKKIAEINKKVFETKWKWKFPPYQGITLLLIISAITLYFFFYSTNDPFYLSVYLPIASFILSASLHTPIQYFVGRIFGIKFIYIYPRGIYMFQRRSNSKIKIEPALKVDYESYLNASPLKRAVMHASGATFTLIAVYFFFIYSIIAKAYIWSIAICGAIAIIYTLTDIFYSAKMAAFKRFLDEYKTHKELKNINKH